MGNNPLKEIQKNHGEAGIDFLLNQYEKAEIRRSFDNEASSGKIANLKN